MVPDASKLVWVWNYQSTSENHVAKIKVLVAKVPTVCAALDCQGGDSGQITAGEVGGRGR